MGAYESGQAFLTGVLAKLPESVRAQVEATFQTPEAKDAIVALGDGTLARSEFSKQMDALKQKQTELDTLYARNTDWYSANERALQEYLQIKPEYETLKQGKPTPPPAAPAGLDEEKVRKITEDFVNQAAVDAVGISAWAATKATEHFRQFGEVLPVQSLINETITARKAGQSVSLDDVYQQKYAAQLKEKADAAEAARIDKLVQEKLAAVRAASPGLPFPVRPDASVLDALDQKADPSQFSVDAAVAEYTRLQAARG